LNKYVDAFLKAQQQKDLKHIIQMKLERNVKWLTW